MLRRPRKRFLLRTLICAGSAALVVSSLSAPALAAARFKPTAPQQVTPVPTRDVPPITAPKAARGSRLPAPVWPAAGSSTITLPSAKAVELGVSSAAVRAPGLAVSVTAQADSPRTAKVTVFGRSQAKAAGIDGLLARIESADGSPMAGTVGVDVDYASFATAYGADWSTRLRLVTLPECALTTPGAHGCEPHPLATRNNTATKTLTASAPVGALVATSSTSSSGSGDYTATKLQPSSTWEAGGNSGDFSWSYPMRVPPSVGGPAPKVTLSYSSQSVDGQMAASNNQPGWAGAGFELAPGGAIERRYKGCGDDMTGGNNSTKTGDLCWATDNATLSLAGHSGELLYNSTEQRWHLRNDDGTRIERKTGTVNGDDDGEYWVVTTTEGTQYWFGANRLAGWTDGKPETGSAWTEPVYGNHTGEPCHASTFAASSCTQAWKWSLDYVIDVNGNSMSLWYATAANKYAANLDTSAPVSYTRDGWLTKIDYGTRNASGADSIFGGLAPVEVEFTADDRCLSSCTTHDAAHWTDTPWDQECTGATCTVTSPTFWSTKRLKQVTTKVLNGSAYRNVETWTLTHSYPDPGDSTRAPLRLDRISHGGGAETVPDATFAYAQKANRVDPVALDGLLPMNWFRISQITTETGAVIGVTYSDPDCVVGSKMPSLAALESNTYRCYPVRWTPDGQTKAIQEFFHKYVVTSVHESDNTGGVQPFGSPEVEHDYTYPADSAAWHYTDEDGLIKDDNKTWSVWRGYPWVGVTTGKTGTGDVLQYTKTTFLRGMNGDKLPTGTRSVTLAATDMNGDGDTTDTGIDAAAVADENTWAGQTRSSITYNGPAGAEISSQVNQPWRSTTATASRTINGVTVDARYTGIEETHSRVALDHTPWWRTSSTHTQFDSYGMPMRADDFGDDAVTGDEQCTVTSYNRNTAAWLLATVSESTRYALTCAAAANPASLTEADVISNVRTSYDTQAWGTMPTKGMVTSVAAATAWTGGAPTDQATTTSSYDPQGRVASVTDALGHTTGTTYTPASGGPLLGTVVTQPSPFSYATTTTIDPAYGLTTAVVDTNGMRTDETYDGLGRLTGVWLPGRDKATQTANLTFAYLVRNTAPSVVTTRRLNPTGGYTASYAFLDGLLRNRQTQSTSPSGGRIVSDTFYDTAGRVLRTYGAYWDNRALPGTTLVTPTDRHNVPDQSYTIYDGAGRATDVVFDPYNNGERWRTHTTYTGDRTDVTPPAGGIATSATSDARGNTTALSQIGYPNATDKVTTSYTYNRKNQLYRVTDAATNYWQYTYSLAGKVLTSRDPDSGTTTMTYDKNGQLATAQNALSQTLVFDYDTLGRKIGLYLGSKSTTNKRATWDYDTAYFDGTATVAKGRLGASTRWTTNGTVGYVKAVHGYDDSYHATGTDITIPAAETGLGDTYTFLSTYRIDGSPDTLQYPGGGSDLTDEAVTTGYDPNYGLANQLTALDEVSQFSYVSDTVYDALSRASRYTFYTGFYSGTGYHAWLSYQRELDTGRMTNIKTSREHGTPNVVSDLTYTYDNSANITKIADGANADNQCFTYDRLRRLTEAWTPTTAPCSTAPTTAGLGGPAKYWSTWTINAVGNRTQQIAHATATGGTDQTTNYTYPAAGATQPHTVTGTSGAAVGAYKYDVAGNTTCRPYAASNTCPVSGAVNSQTIGWDEEGHVASSQDTTGQTKYLYDADGSRLIRTDPTGKTLYLPGEDIRYTTATGTRTATRYYTFGGATIASRTINGLTWLAGDHQGTADVAIDEATQATTIRRQTPFGASRGTTVSWPNSRGFVGGVNDNTGLTHLGAREYDPALGKFISVDPLFDKSDPQSINNYAYADHSPIVMTDAAGTRACEDGGNCSGQNHHLERRLSCDDACHANNVRLAKWWAGLNIQASNCHAGLICPLRPKYVTRYDHRYYVDDKSVRLGLTTKNDHDVDMTHSAGISFGKSYNYNYSWGQANFEADALGVNLELALEESFGLGGSYTFEKGTEGSQSYGKDWGAAWQVEYSPSITVKPGMRAYTYPEYEEHDLVIDYYVGHDYQGTGVVTERKLVSWNFVIQPIGDPVPPDATLDNGYSPYSLVQW